MCGLVPGCVKIILVGLGLGLGTWQLFKRPNEYDKQMILKNILLLSAWALADWCFNSASALPLNNCTFLLTNSLLSPQFSCLQNGG